MHPALAALSASAVPALVMAGVSLAGGTYVRWVAAFAGAAYLVGLAYVALLGVPCVALLRRIGQLNWLTVCLCGFLLSSVSYGLLMVLADPSASQYSHATDGQWLIHFIFATWLGLLGSITAAAFYALLPRGEA
jgi:hypothetical protein